MSFVRSTSFCLLSVIVIAAGLLLVGCDSNEPNVGIEQPLRSVSYPLQAQSNDGAIPEGVSGTVTFWEVNSTQTLVTLELDDGATGTSVAHPAHIHINSVENGGDIDLYLTPIDGQGGGGTSARVLQKSYDTMVDFDGHVKVHESVANLETVVAQGNVGANTEGNHEDGLNLVDDLQTSSYSLSATSNEGSKAPEGISGTVSIQALTEDLTLVSVSLNASGATDADVSHPVHIHTGTVEQGGGIEHYLGPIDGTDETAASSKLLEVPYGDLMELEGHVNVHESNANLDAVVSQGNVGRDAQN